MFASAAFLGLIEGFTPGGASFDAAPAAAAGLIAVAVAVVGPKLDRRALLPLAPVGTAMIAYSLAQTPGAGDGAVLYFWPVLWTAYFFGRRATVSIVAWVAIVHAVALHTLPHGAGYLDRWIDVVVVLSTSAAVIQALATRERRLAAELRSEARIDALTGLLNRRGFEERIPRELALAARNSWRLTLVAFDIDRFKAVNDKWGHEVGDLILSRFGDILRKHARGTDLAARVGGEEFLVLFPATDAPAASRFAERVRAAFANERPSGLPAVTVSAGVASVEVVEGAAAGRSSFGRLLREADSALYAAKRAGRNQTRTPIPGRTSTRRTRIGPSFK